MTGSLDNAKESLLDMITKDDFDKWTSKNDRFKSLLNEEIDVIFKDPHRIMKAFEVEGSVSLEESELLDILASKVVESLPSPTDDVLGFTRVVDFMASLKKPLIGHNGILDLMFLYDKFFRPLPDTQTEFKAGVNGLFPHIFDTKHMVNTRQELQQLFPNSMLSEAYLRVQKDDFQFGDQRINIHPSFPEYTLSG